MSLVRVSIALMALTLAACASTTAPAPTPAVAAPAPVGRLSTPAAAPAPAPAPTSVVRPATMIPAHEDPSSPLSRERSVYFDFDEAVVRQGDIAVVERHGQYLAQHSNLKVLLEGNTDERGGSEYNLALGQRRAEAVKNALKVLGVKEAQMDPVSVGKEKPVAQGHNEAAWKLNRRVDIVYTR